MNRHWWAPAALQALWIVLAVYTGDWWWTVAALLSVLDFATTARLAYWQRRLLDAMRERERTS